MDFKGVTRLTTGIDNYPAATLGDDGVEPGLIATTLSEVVIAGRYLADGSQVLSAFIPGNNSVLINDGPTSLSDHQVVPANDPLAITGLEQSVVILEGEVGDDGLTTPSALYATEVFPDEGNYARIGITTDVLTFPDACTQVKFLNNANFRQLLVGLRFNGETHLVSLVPILE